MCNFRLGFFPKRWVNNLYTQREDPVPLPGRTGSVLEYRPSVRCEEAYGVRRWNMDR